MFKSGSVLVRSTVAAVMFLPFLFSSCSPKVYPVETKDSVRVEYRDRIDTVIAEVQIPVEIEKIVTRDTVSHLENTYAVSDAMVMDGMLHHSLSSIPQIIRVPVTVEVHDTTYIEKSYEKDVVEVNRLTKWQSFLITWSKIASAILLIGLIALAVRLYFKFTI